MLKNVKIYVNKHEILAKNGHFSIANGQNDLYFYKDSIEVLESQKQIKIKTLW